MYQTLEFQAYRRNTPSRIVTFEIDSNPNPCKFSSAPSVMHEKQGLPCPLPGQPGRLSCLPLSTPATQAPQGEWWFAERATPARQKVHAALSLCFSSSTLGRNYPALRRHKSYSPCLQDRDRDPPIKSLARAAAPVPTVHAHALGRFRDIARLQRTIAPHHLAMAEPAKATVGAGAAA